MKDIKIEFEIDNLNLNIVSYKNERKSFEAQSAECELFVSFWYDYSEKPLNL